MRNLLIPALLLLVLPGLWIAARRGLLERRVARWGLGLSAVVLTASVLPWGGLDFGEIKRINLLLAGVTAFVIYRHHRLGGGRERGGYRLTLAALAVLSIVVYNNFFVFHGAPQPGSRVYVHLHDAAHYYLGGKYFDELGYTDLYTAMLRAEAELYQDRFRALEARDLETYELVHITVLLRKSDPVKAAFTPKRWASFQQDVRYFRERLGQQYGGILKDHGYNPTPVWTLIGGSLAQLVPAGSATGILLLCLLDELLLVALFFAVYRAFGVEAMLLAIIEYCIVFGAGFGWTGGAFLRYLWLFGVVTAVCLLRRRRWAMAGSLLALATMLRVFPCFFALPIFLRGALRGWKSRRLPPSRYVRFSVAFTLTCVLLFGATLVMPRGFGQWREFHANLQIHMKNISPNVVGLTEVLAWRPWADREVTAEEFEALKERRRGIRNLQMVLVFVPLLCFAFWRMRRRSDRGSLIWTLPLLFCGLSLAAYYYAFLILIPLFFRRTPWRIVLLFVIETASYALLLFETRDGTLFVYRSWLMAIFSVAILLPAAPSLPTPPSATPLPATPPLAASPDRSHSMY